MTIEVKHYPVSEDNKREILKTEKTYKLFGIVVCRKIYNYADRGANVLIDF